jgi:hypothetical protein
MPKPIESEPLPEIVRRALANPREGIRSWGIQRAYQMGGAGVPLLAEVVSTLHAYYSVDIIHCFALLDDDQSLEVLRQQAHRTGPGSSDPRCVALLSLAYRLGAESTPDLVEALESSHGDARGYALLCLALVGDERAWSSVLRWLASSRAGTRRGVPSAVSQALSYLIRVSDHARPIEAVADVLRRGWSKLSADDRDWLAAQWPDLNGRPSLEQASAWAHPAFLNFFDDVRVKRAIDVGDTPTRVSIR